MRPAERLRSLVALGPRLAQSAVDCLLNSAYELVLEGDSYRRHQKSSGSAIMASHSVGSRLETTTVLARR